MHRRPVAKSIRVVQFQVELKRRSCCDEILEVGMYSPLIFRASNSSVISNSVSPMATVPTKTTVGLEGDHNAGYRCLGFLGWVLMLIKRGTGIGAVTRSKHHAMAGSLQLEKQLISKLEGRLKLRFGHHNIYQALLPGLEEALVDDAPLLKDFMRPNNNRVLP